MLEFLRSLDPMDWLTVGLLLFAGAQVWVQYRTERQRRIERSLDRDEATDRAFQYVWAEHFRLDSLADHLDRRDLIEMSLLGVLKPQDVLPRDGSRLVEAVSSLSREAGWLGGVTTGLCHEIERSIAILVSSINGFAESAPRQLDPARRVQYLRQHYGADLQPWETAVRKGVRELANLLWDAAKHNPRAALPRELSFSDDLSSEFARAAVGALAKRAAGSPPTSSNASGNDRNTGAA